MITRQQLNIKLIELTISIEKNDRYNIRVEKIQVMDNILKVYYEGYDYDNTCVLHGFKFLNLKNYKILPIINMVENRNFWNICVTFTNNSNVKSNKIVQTFKYNNNLIKGDQ